MHVGWKYITIEGSLIGTALTGCNAIVLRLLLLLKRHLIHNHLLHRSMHHWKSGTRNHWRWYNLRNKLIY